MLNPISKLDLERRKLEAMLIVKIAKTSNLYILAEAIQQELHLRGRI